MPALNTNKQTNKTLTATIPVQQFCFFIIFVDTVHWHFCLNLCTHFAHPKCLAVQCSEPKVACKTPFSCRLFTFFKLILAINLYPTISIMTYTTAFSVSTNNHLTIKCHPHMALVMLKQKLRSSNSSPGPVSTWYSSQPSASPSFTLQKFIQSKDFLTRFTFNVLLFMFPIKKKSDLKVHIKSKHKHTEDMDSI